MLTVTKEYPGGLQRLMARFDAFMLLKPSTQIVIAITEPWFYREIEFLVLEQRKKEAALTQRKGSEHV